MAGWAYGLARMQNMRRVSVGVGRGLQKSELVGGGGGGWKVGTNIYFKLSLTFWTLAVFTLEDEQTRRRTNYLDRQIV